IQNNCSGKHAAMLALAKHLGAPTETYNELSNPVQHMITQTVSDFSGVRVEDIAIGIDGCGVPVFGISVRAMAVMYARLISPPVKNYGSRPLIHWSYIGSRGRFAWVTYEWLSICK